jgi:hypothetical protein
MTVVYDAGVLVRADRSDRRTWADHRARLEAGIAILTTAPVAARVSRSPRQAQLHRLLRGCEVVPFSGGDSHRVGALLARSATADVVDAHVALVAHDRHADVVTSDVADLGRVVRAIGGSSRVHRA